MGVGIYSITCGNHIYIGKSVDIEKRWKRHLKLLQNKKHFNRYLQNIFNKYGENSLNFSIVEFCQKEQLNKIEIMKIKEFRNNINYICINFSLEDHNTGPGKEGAEIIRKKALVRFEDLNLREKARSYTINQMRPVKVWKLDNHELIDEFDSAHSAAKFLNVKQAKVTECCQKKLYSHKKFIIRYKEDLYPFEWKGEYIKGRRFKAINIITNEIIEFTNQSIAGKTLNIKATNISACLRPNHYAKSVKGYRFEYVPI